MRAQFVWSFGEDVSSESLNMGLGDPDPVLRLTDTFLDLGLFVWRRFNLDTRLKKGWERSLVIAQSNEEILRRMRQHAGA